MIAENGDTATVSCDGVGGLVRFPLSASLRVVSVVVRSASTIAQENGYHGIQNVVK